MRSFGKLISFEGPEGSGKTTQLNLLKTFLEGRGYAVEATREPGGGSSLSQEIRRILLGNEHPDICEETELFLLLAARVEHVRKLILPKLQDGVIVLCDRFIESSIAYQGYGRGLPVKTIEMMNRFAIKGRYPDLTLVFDIDPALGLERAGSGSGPDRIESETLEFHERVRKGFLELIQEGGRFYSIDAHESVDKVEKRVRQCVLGALVHEN
jgi:dTMP kinase